MYFELFFSTTKTCTRTSIHRKCRHISILLSPVKCASLTLMELIIDVPELGEATTVNYSDYGTEYECSHETQGTTFNTVFQVVFYSFLFLLGMAGNGLMMMVLLRRRHALRITEIYLLHLAMTDLMLLLTFPFDLVEITRGWLFGEFLCKLVGLLQTLNLLCGSFLLACIGFDRYLAIVYAIPSMQRRCPRTVHFACIVLWLICFGLSIPNVVFLSVKTDTPTNSSRLTCYYHDYDIHANNWVLANRILNPVYFFLPMSVMTYCYAAIVVTLRKSQKRQEKQGAIRLALLVTVVFCICWLPYNVTLLLKTVADWKLISYESCRAFIQIQTALDVTESLGFSHCCLNPFLYAFVGVRFRNELIELLCRLGCSRACLRFFRAYSHTRPSSSDCATSNSTM
ncbi:C-X-C chemokine receptor type 5 [Thalassophryne amazonica]|uniref:C-X-C chemokine receptor type 5 n=1 Tax=Thalassophryne amazonica TaxID=390379 RepID=UPI0014722A99|nr:C-X-C chemokine receptor type 5 [Thalassophryne amazonica]